MTSWPRYLLSMKGRGELECRWVVLEKERDREGERHRKGGERKEGTGDSRRGWREREQSFELAS